LGKPERDAQGVVRNAVLINHETGGAGTQFLQPQFAPGSFSASGQPLDAGRRTRNDAGHPTGRRMERDEIHALLLLFPTYCKMVHDLMVWLATNKI
jgi:hypothetical protein